jgi:hypothetical protein
MLSVVMTKVVRLATVLLAMLVSPLCQAFDSWETDYSTAVRKATAEKKMLLIYFADASVSAPAESAWLGDANLAKSLANYVMLKVPTTVEAVTAEGTTKLLSHAAFCEMQRSAGFAILDYANEKGPYFGQVISVYPFCIAGVASPRDLQMLLTLPVGTLTQRTLILAVRLHPEAPASTTGQFDPDLAVEAESHAQHQANIRYQGHHSWESRFHRINGRLSGRRGGAWSATEVCAESWPNQGLFDSAVECVHSWRQSSGHWSAVRSGQAAYGYDMKRGSNGTWYAAGIFGNFR